MQPISISLGDDEIPCEMQLELEHMTLDEAIASGLFDLPDEPGTVQIPVTVHVTIPDHLLWPPMPPTPEPQRTADPGWGHVPVGGSARRRFGNYPKAIAAQRIAESIRSTLDFYGDEEAAAFRAMLAAVNDGRVRSRPPECRDPNKGASSDLPLRMPVELARDEAGSVEDEPGEKRPPAAAEPELENGPARLEVLRPDAPAIENIPYPPVAGPFRPGVPEPRAEATDLTIEPGLQPATKQSVGIELRAGVIGAYGLPRPRLPSFRAGESDGGPGVWVRESEKYPHSNPKAAAYQQRATGAPAGTEYLLTEVPARFMKLGKKYFDSYDPETNTLIDAKNYTGWPKEELGFSMKRTADDIQVEADLAEHFGCALELRVATQEKADLLQELVEDNKIENVVVRCCPPP